ncbi:mitochondrial import receptor subunit TOM5 homolog [Desmodus rotundus]|uniref:mitochondrial import receptor subunit TOM5 homolog n=1 Tax=Desmodus rotundus TaxID=9430 RepID=UPI00238102AA|nr:mitochondrial import receptor subunit TOM5 homolog [Desmodus rotundus]
MLPMDGLTRKLDHKETRRKMRKDVIFSTRNFLIYVALLQGTLLILKKLDSIQRLSITRECKI